MAEPADRLVDDPHGGRENEDRLDGARDVLELAVTVGMALVRGFTCFAYAKQGDERGDQVDSRMDGFGEDPTEPISRPTATLRTMRPALDATDNRATPVLRRPVSAPSRDGATGGGVGLGVGPSPFSLISTIIASRRGKAPRNH